MKKKRNTVLFEFQNKSGTSGTCARCGRETEMLNVDHIIPAHFLLSLGLDNERYDDADNLELVCRPCNVLKAGNIDINHRKTFGLLKKYITKSEQLYASNS